MLPINSALNPVLYTLTTKLFKQQLARIVYTWRANGIPVASPADSSGISLSSAHYNGRHSKNSASITTSDVRKFVVSLNALSHGAILCNYSLQQVQQRHSEDLKTFTCSDKNGLYRGFLFRNLSTTGVSLHR